MLNGCNFLIGEYNGIIAKLSKIGLAKKLKKEYRGVSEAQHGHP